MQYALGKLETYWNAVPKQVRIIIYNSISALFAVLASDLQALQSDVGRYAAILVGALAATSLYYSTKFAVSKK